MPTTTPCFVLALSLAPVGTGSRRYLARMHLSLRRMYQPLTCELQARKCKEHDMRHGISREVLAAHPPIVETTLGARGGRVTCASMLALRRSTSPSVHHACAAVSSACQYLSTASFSRTSGHTPITIPANTYDYSPCSLTLPYITSPLLLADSADAHLNLTSIIEKIYIRALTRNPLHSFFWRLRGSYLGSRSAGK